MPQRVRRPATPEGDLERLQRSFLDAVPRIEAHGRVYFRYVKCWHKREEYLAEMVGIGWKWWVRLHHKGKDPSQFESAIATFAAKAVNSGRRLCGLEKAKDAMSPRAQRRHSFAVGKLPDFSTLSTNPLAEALTDNTRSPVDEQVCFRLDFPRWLASLGDRKRRIAEDLMLGERT